MQCSPGNRNNIKAVFSRPSVEGRDARTLRHNQRHPLRPSDCLRPALPNAPLNPGSKKNLD